MIYVEIIHESGKKYLLPASQCTVFADTGDPVALTYEHAGLVLHSDVEHKDFAETCESLHVQRLEKEGVGQ